MRDPVLREQIQSRQHTDRPSVAPRDTIMSISTYTDIYLQRPSVGLADRNEKLRRQLAGIGADAPAPRRAGPARSRVAVLFKTPLR